MPDNELASYQGQKEITEAIQNLGGFENTLNAANNAERAKQYALSAGNSASSASTTATQLMEYLEDKEELTAPAVDPTLSISGAAADAKVTGEFRTNEHNSDMDYILSGTMMLPYVFESGDIFNGMKRANTQRIRTANRVPVVAGLTLNIADGYRIYVVYNDIDVTDATQTDRYTNSGWYTGSYTLIGTSGFTHCWINIGKVTEGDTADVPTFASQVTVKPQNTQDIEELFYESNGARDFYSKDIYRAKGMWKYGSVSNSTYSAIKYRVMSALQYADTPVRINVQSGFGFYIVNSNSAGAYQTSDTILTTQSRYIGRGSYFYIVVRRTTEDATEVADIDTFSNQVYFNNPYAELGKGCHNYMYDIGVYAGNVTWQNYRIDLNDAMYRLATKLIYTQKQLILRTNKLSNLIGDTDGIGITIHEFNDDTLSTVTSTSYTLTSSPIALPVNKVFRLSFKWITESGDHLTPITDVVNSDLFKYIYAVSLDDLADSTAPIEANPFIKEIYLKGIDPTKFYCVDLVAYNFDPTDYGQSAGNIYTGVSIREQSSVTSTTSNRVASSVVYHTKNNQPKGNLFALSEANSSGITGYVLVDFSALNGIGRDYPSTIINNKQAVSYESNPVIYQEVSNAYSSASESIINLNKDVEPLVIQSTKQPEYMIEDGNKTPLTFAHFGDIHANLTMWNRIVDYINHYADYLAFGINAGDYVSGDQGAYVDLYADGTPCVKPILNCVGNHDTYIAGHQGTLNPDKSVVYSLLFNHTSNWGVTFITDVTYPTAYYKDFADQNIRLIVLDEYYDTATQVTWLEGLLAEAITLGYHVITMTHNVSDTITTYLDTNFNTYEPSYYEIYGTPFDATIKEFKDAGGIHVAHIVGHQHRDLIGRTANDTLNISVECATTWNYWTDGYRVPGTKTYDCFNVFTVDTMRNIIKIVRIGDNADYMLRHKNYWVYNYVTKQKIVGD